MDHLFSAALYSKPAAANASRRCPALPRWQQTHPGSVGASFAAEAAEVFAATIGSEPGALAMHGAAPVVSAPAVVALPPSDEEKAAATAEAAAADEAAREEVAREEAAREEVAREEVECADGTTVEVKLQELEDGAWPRDSSSGHQLLLPLAKWCPIFASWTT